MRFHPGVIFRLDELQLCRPDELSYMATYIPGRDLTLQLQFRRKGYDDGVTYHNASGRNIAPGWNLIV